MATCSSPQPQDLSKWEQVLAVLLQHSQSSCCSGPNSQQRLVCALLSTSKTLRAAVNEQLAGQVHVMRCKPHPAATVCRKPQSATLGPWLAKHGHLMQSLQLDLPSSSDGTAAGNSSNSQHETESQVIAGLSAAAASATGLQLQALITSTPRAAFLAALPSKSLTRLEMLDWEVSKVATVQPMAAALAGLTGLKELTVRPKSCSGFKQSSSNELSMDEQLISEIQRLSALTKLHIKATTAQYAIACQRQLPVQLMSLHLEPYFVDGNWASLGPLRPGHLTALTGLDTRIDDRFGGYDQAAGDVLPASLLVLALGNCSSTVAPLLQLQQLQCLKMNGCWLLAEQLQQLSQLRCLGSLHLRFTYDEDAVAAAAAWPLLPLVHLHINHNNAFQLGSLPLSSSIATAAPQQVNKLAGLTQLELQNLCVEGSEQQAATVLGMLTGLQQLCLDCLRLPEAAGQIEAGIDEPAAAAAATAGPASSTVGAPTCQWQQLMRSTGLPLLTSLELNNMELGAAAAELAGATGLTRLHLIMCDLADNVVTSVVAKVQAAQDLSIWCNERVTNAVCPAIAALRHLSSLNVLSTQITTPGCIEHLRCVTSLRHLRAGEKIVCIAQQQGWPLGTLRR